jgi:hypothetical protein
MRKHSENFQLILLAIAFLLVFVFQLILNICSQVPFSTGSKNILVSLGPR